MTSARVTTPPRPLRIGDQQVPALGRVRMYVCGITPYDVTHLGHAATFIWADAADKVLTWAGNTVSVARNVIDVDDALFAEAARRGQPATLFGAMQRASFEATMSSLRVRVPDHSPTAAQAIGPVIQLAATLLANGHAYLRNGSVYARSWGAGAGVHRDPELRPAGEHQDHNDDHDDSEKDDPLDIAVWRALPAAQTTWPSPWGPGRPGWHAECAATVLALYGPSVDIHCGGADLAYPHHAAEAALAEAATGVVPFARSWLRAGIVDLAGQKMTGSLGNVVLVDDLLRDHPPAAIRLMCLNRPREQSWTYVRALLDHASDILEQLYSAAGKPDPSAPASVLADALLNGLDIMTAVAVALAEGGATARALIDVLALT
jgi:cysteinyl-tRNA synthetase